ncbi:MAG: DUF1697 domain-containing protein [Burkholderiaceae bacterium]|nr:DUF1697 domain-containing protein [Burkholderiaceae bacterium]
MTIYIALLRAVNVGGTGKLPMKDLVEICQSLGFAHVKTYIASGNVIFMSKHTAERCQQELEAALAAYTGKPVGVFIRRPEQLEILLKENPYADKEGNRTISIFLDKTPMQEILNNIKGQRDELIVCGTQAIYVYYGTGMADSKLVIPAAKSGTARNMNTLTKLLSLARKIEDLIDEP